MVPGVAVVVAVVVDVFVVAVVVVVACILVQGAAGLVDDVSNSVQKMAQGHFHRRIF